MADPWAINAFMLMVGGTFLLIAIGTFWGRR